MPLSRRTRWWRYATIVVVASVLNVACNLSTPARSTPGSTAGANATGEVSLATPTNFREVCRFEPQVCVEDPSAASSFPEEFARPLTLPSVAAGGPCPISPSQDVEVPTAGFGGLALGRGPVRPVIAGPAATTSSSALVLKQPTAGERWYQFKTLWYSDPTYPNAVLIRGRRLDQPGPIAFGEQPSLSELVIPTGPTLNGSSGYREAPGATYLLGPGCYGWQVDGSGLSETIVFRAVL